MYILLLYFESTYIARFYLMALGLPNAVHLPNSAATIPKAGGQLNRYPI